MFISSQNFGSALLQTAVACMYRWIQKFVFCSFYSVLNLIKLKVMLDCDYAVRRKFSYHPVPIVFSQAKGSTVWDPEGNKYLDFLSAYSAVNQGHCHPKIMKSLQEQAEKLTLSSRAFYNDKFPVFAERISGIFGYEMALPMNTGAEGVETALKLARKWGYEKKKIPKDEVISLHAQAGDHIVLWAYIPRDEITLVG